VSGLTWADQVPYVTRETGKGVFPQNNACESRGEYAFYFKSIEKSEYDFEFFLLSFFYIHGSENVQIILLFDIIVKL